MKIKKTFLLVVVLLTTAFFSYAQTSDMGFSFQGYAIDPDGKALASKGVTVQFTITPGTFQEQHNVTTDAFGVFHAVVGNSSAAANEEFKKLDFTKKGAVYTLKVEVKETSGGVYTTISNEPMKAVPYARYAFNGVPVGTIVAYGGDKNNVPEGWLICDGSSVAQADYPQLYAIIGSAWGESGASFNLPDLRGRFLRGVDDRAAGTGLDPDAPRTVGSTQSEDYLQHNHNVTANGHNHTYGDIYWSEAGGTVTVPSNVGDDGGDNDNAGFEISRTTSSSNANISESDMGGNETRPDNAAVYYIIKY